MFSIEKIRNKELYVFLDSLRSVNHLLLGPFAMDDNPPVKARDTSLYIFKLETAELSPNLFSTSDFSHYNRALNVFPEHEYNWLTAELVTWKTPDGALDQGILYKPENFDRGKKYPMLIHYYEQYSENLYRFNTPEPSGGHLIFLVSHGYLVFIPIFTIRWVGRARAPSALLCPVLYILLKALRRYKKRIGLQGISFGGFETNYADARPSICRGKCPHRE